MVMPSYIGPTNMPIYEAFVAGCPVISSNSGEMVSQVGEAGIIFDPDNKYALVSSILSLYDQKLRNELIKKGNCRVEMLKPEIWGVEYVNNIID
jgi:glycosyltransferase involved in cell wall biosynthesis